MTAYCVNCGQSQTINCTEAQYQWWQSGIAIQVAMPDVPAAERELLLSGICATCWERYLPDEED